MPIEFYCPSCKTLLKTPDNTAGQTAKCPKCRTLATVPSPAPGGSPFDSAKAPSQEQPQNPFAPPLSGTYGGYRAPDSGLRNGPPWEREGKSVGTFFRTMLTAYDSSNFLFKSMRREGGFGPPLMYSFIGSNLVLIPAAVFWVCLVAMGIVAGVAQQPNAAPAGLGFLIIAVVLGVYALIVEISFLVAPFVVSGFIHLSLMLFGGAKHPYETTFRVYNYALGSTTLINLIPFFGPIVSIVIQIAGLSAAHDISPFRAAAGFFGVFLGCCLLCGLPVLTLQFFALLAGNL